MLVIHKFLVMTKRIFLSSTKLDETLHRVQCVELYMPVQTYWDVLGMLKEVDYLLASEEPVVDIQLMYKEIYHKLIPFAKSDGDRNMLLAKLGIKT